MQIKFEQKTLALKHPFHVSTGSKLSAENIFVEITHDGITGRGEAAPSRFFHETPASVIETLEKIARLLGDDPFLVPSIAAKVDAQIPGNSAAKAAVNMALYDWIGLRLNLPLRRYLGIDVGSHPICSSFTIGIDTLEVIEQKVREASTEPLLKVKLGTPEDYAIISRIRELTDKPLYVDANEGWTRDEAREKIDWLAGQNVQLIEQPLPADDLAGTRWLRQQVTLPLIADESVKTAADLIQIGDAFDGFNIKLMKCGGITEALKMIQIGRWLNLSIMFGCFLESSLAISAAAPLAALCDYVDLDGHLLLKDDPFIGIEFNQGMITLTDAPGLGVRQRD